MTKKKKASEEEEEGEEEEEKLTYRPVSSTPVKTSFFYQVRKSFSNHLRALALLDGIFLLVSILTLGLPRIWDWYWKVIFLSMAPVLFGLLHTFRFETSLS